MPAGQGGLAGGPGPGWGSLTSGAATLAPRLGGRVSDQRGRDSSTALWTFEHQSIPPDVQGLVMAGPENRPNRAFGQETLENDRAGSTRIDELDLVQV